LPVLAALARKGDLPRVKSETSKIYQLAGEITLLLVSAEQGARDLRG